VPVAYAVVLRIVALVALVARGSQGTWSSGEIEPRYLATNLVLSWELGKH
jgi:hypothetical protein